MHDRSDTDVTPTPEEHGDEQHRIAQQLIRSELHAEQSADTDVGCRVRVDAHVDRPEQTAAESDEADADEHPEEPERVGTSTRRRPRFIRREHLIGHTRIMAASCPGCRSPRACSRSARGRCSPCGAA